MKICTFYVIGSYTKKIFALTTYVRYESDFLLLIISFDKKVSKILIKMLIELNNFINLNPESEDCVFWLSYFLWILHISYHWNWRLIISVRNFSLYSRKPYKNPENIVLLFNFSTYLYVEIWSRHTIITWIPLFVFNNAYFCWMKLY